MIIDKTLFESINKKQLTERVFGRAQSVGEKMEHGWHEKHMDRLAKDVIETEIEFNKIGEKQ